MEMGGVFEHGGQVGPTGGAKKEWGPKPPLLCIRTSAWPGRPRDVKGTAGNPVQMGMDGLNSHRQPAVPLPGSQAGIAIDRGLVDFHGPSLRRQAAVTDTDAAGQRVSPIDIVLFGRGGAGLYQDILYGSPLQCVYMFNEERQGGPCLSRSITTT